MEELEEIAVKIEPKELDNDLQPIEFTTYMCQPDLDIKHDYENDITEMLQWNNEDARKAKTSISDRLQIKMVEENKNIQRENKEPKNTNEEIEKFKEEVDPLEQSERTKKTVEVIQIGPISVSKELNIFAFHCKIQNCNYSSEDKKAFAVHCEITHKDFFYNFSKGECNICSIKFDYKGKFVTVYDVYLHMVTMHKDFFEPELTPLIMEEKEEALSSKMKFPVITSVQPLASKMKQLVSMNQDDLKCASVLIGIPMTDIEKQNKKCPEAIAVMMKPPLLSALYKCPKYDCSFSTRLPLSFQKHLVAHHTTLMGMLVPCLYCDHKVLCSSYVIHLEVRHGHCRFGCGNCFYRTTNSYFITIHHEFTHPNTEFNILQLEVVTSNRISADTTAVNLDELVPPYNCKDDGFLSCLFKTLYFDDYLKHAEAIHQVEELGSFSSELELQREAVMEGWLAKQIGPFQCGYCKKATVTHQEMGRHQAVFHSQEQCLFYYRKFVPKDTVVTPEQVNLEDLSFIDHVIHLPAQIHLCDFKLMDGLTNWKSKVSLPLLPSPAKDTETNLDKLSVSLDEPKTFSVLVKDAACLFEESKLKCLDKQPEDGGAHNDTMLQCKWKDCQNYDQTYDSQTALVEHIEKNHVWVQGNGEFTCFWINCPRKLKPYASKQYLSIHMRVHSGEKPYKCVFQGCNETFACLGTLKNHQENHIKPYWCQSSNCFESFSHSSDRDNHQRTHYDTCKWKGCYQTCGSQKTLVEHIEKNHVQLQKGEEFSCFWINCKRKSKPYTTRHSLSVHMRLHSGEKPYKCDSCNKPFSYISSLKIHERSHTGKRPYLCEFPNCSESFSDSYIRNNHQRMHYPPKAFACQVTGCRKKFADPSGLRKHMKYHSAYEQLKVKRKLVEEKQKQSQRTHCDILQCKWKGCNKSYDSQITLINHVGENHIQLEIDEELICSWINCPRNSKPFTTKQNLLVHVRIHTGEKPYKCPFQSCHKAFSQLGHLQAHERGHSKKRPYSCLFSQCFKSFSTSLERDCHQMTHYEGYICQVTACSKKYTDPKSLGIHMEKQHMVDEQLEALQKSADFVQKTKCQRIH